MGGETFKFSATGLSQGKGKQSNSKRNQSRSSSTGHFHSSGSAMNVQHKPSKAQEPRFKKVCVLPSPEYDTVPRGKAKAKLIELGAYVDAW